MKPYPAYKSSRMDWLQIPDHWEECRARFYFREVNDRSESGDEELLSVSHITGVTPRSEKNINMFMAEDYTGHKLCGPGDLVINSLWTWMGALGIAWQRGIVSSAYGVYRLKGQTLFEPKYLDYLVRLKGYVGEYIRRSKGVWTSRLGLNKSDFYDIPIVRPPLDEQRAIVTFLNRKLEEIDRYIANKENLIALLQEQNAALVNRAVSRGLDTNIKLKPSGIDRLGDIPSHWEVRKIKHLAKILRGKFTHRPRNAPELYDGQYPFIQTGDVASANKYITEYHQTLNEMGLAVSKQFPKGTLVMTIAANVGDLAILDFQACFPDSVVGFVPRDLILLDYLYYLLKSMKDEFIKTSPINTQLNLNVDRIGALWVTFPPKDEQEIINRYIESENTKIDSAISLAQREIDLIQEYRISLIAEAVTGKIDVCA